MRIPKSNSNKSNGKEIPSIDVELDKYALDINVDIRNVELVYHAFLAGWEARDKLIKSREERKDERGS